MKVTIRELLRFWPISCPSLCVSDPKSEKTEGKAKYHFGQKGTKTYHSNLRK